MAGLPLPELTTACLSTERKSKSSRDTKSKGKRKVSVIAGSQTLGALGRRRAGQGGFRGLSGFLSLGSHVGIPAPTPSQMGSAAAPCPMITAATQLMATWDRTWTWIGPLLQVRVLGLPDPTGCIVILGSSLNTGRE